MKRLVIGSTAMKYWFPLYREPKDLDAFSNVDVPGEDTLWHKNFDQFWSEDFDRVATPEELMTIVASHLFWDLRNNSWTKHMATFRYLKRLGYEVQEDLFKMLYTTWIDVHGSKKMDLKKEEDEFFADAVKRIYDHDSLHRSLANEYGKPRYERYLKPGHSVDMEMSKVWAQPHEEIVTLFQEEIEATALERILVPRDMRGSPGAAYLWALRRCLTSLLKGRSARFVLDNIEEFSKPTDYVKRHLAGKEFLIKL